MANRVAPLSPLPHPPHPTHPTGSPFCPMSFGSKFVGVDVGVVAGLWGLLTPLAWPSAPRSLCPCPSLSFTRHGRPYLLQRAEDDRE